MSRFDWHEIRKRLAESQSATQREPEQVLAARARRLAERGRETARRTTSLLSFRLGGRPHAMALSDLAGVVPLEGWTELPKSPPELVGLMAHRGTIVPLYCLARLTGLEPGEGRAALLLGEPPVACRVDELEQIVTVELDQVEAQGLILLQARTLAAHPIFTREDTR